MSRHSELHFVNNGERQKLTGGILFWKLRIFRGRIRASVYPLPHLKASLGQPGLSVPCMFRTSGQGRGGGRGVKMGLLTSFTEGSPGLPRWERSPGSAPVLTGMYFKFWIRPRGALGILPCERRKTHLKAQILTCVLSSESQLLNG